MSEGTSPPSHHRGYSPKKGANIPKSRPSCVSYMLLVDAAEARHCMLLLLCARYATAWNYATHEYTRVCRRGGEDFFFRKITTPGTFLPGALLRFWTKSPLPLSFSPRGQRRPKKKTGLFMGHDPTRGMGQEVFKMSRVGSGRVGSGGFSKPHGSGHGTLTRPDRRDPTRPARFDLTREHP